jgi:hypothetical protein
MEALVLRYTISRDLGIMAGRRPEKLKQSMRMWQIRFNGTSLIPLIINPVSAGISNVWLMHRGSSLSYSLPVPRMRRGVIDEGTG